MYKAGWPSSARLARLVAARLGSVRLGAASRGLVRRGSARLTRLGATRLASSFWFSLLSSSSECHSSPGMPRNVTLQGRLINSLFFFCQFYVAESIVGALRDAKALYRGSGYPLAHRLPPSHRKRRVKETSPLPGVRMSSGALGCHSSILSAASKTRAPSH